MAQVEVWNYVFIGILGFWMIVSLLANFCILTASALFKNMRTFTNLFIGNIAVSDTLLVAYVLPQMLHDVSHADYYFEPDFLCRSVNAMPIFCITASVYFMTVMSIERWYSIARNRSLIRGSKTSVAVVCSVWLFSAVVSLPTFIENRVETVEEADEFGNVTLNLVCHQGISREFTLGNGFTILFVSYIIPQIIIYTNYARLACFIYSKSKMTAGESVNEATSAVFKSKVKVIKMLVSVAVLFSVSWMPYFVIQTITVVSNGRDSTAFDGPYFLSQIVLATFSTSYNFILYLVFVKSYRRAFKRMFTCNRRREVEPSADRNAGESSQVTHMHNITKPTSTDRT